MRIKSVKLSNGYKRFRDLSIDLGDNPSRFVALVGPNGCGKSSVFDGLLFLHNAHESLGNTGSMDNNYHSLDSRTQIELKDIQVEFTSGSYREVFDRKDGMGKRNTIFSFRSPYRYNSNVKIPEIRSIEEIYLNNYGASTTVALDAKMEANYRRLLAKFSRYRDENDVRPSEARKHVMGELNAALRHCLDLTVSSLGDVESNRGTIYFTKSDQSKEFEYNVLSSGEKEVVDILLDLYLRKDDYDDTVFIIDEPELHINTAIQRKLLIEVDKLVGKTCQVWVATHSIGFLRALQDDIRDCQIISFEAGANFAEAQYVLEPIQKTRQQWQRIFKTALDDLSGLVSPKSLIYCEGKAESKSGEEQGVDAIVYNNVFSKNHNDTLFISSGGNTEPEQRSRIAIDILRKAFIDVRILVLSDRDIDPAGLTSEADRTKHLKVDANRRMLMRRELENYLYDSEVLIKYAASTGNEFDMIKYKQVVEDIVNDNVKDKTGLIKDVCGENRSISPKQFKIELSKCISADMAVFNELRACIFD